MQTVQNINRAGIAQYSFFVCNLFILAEVFIWECSWKKEVLQDAIDSLVFFFILETETGQTVKRSTTHKPNIFRYDRHVIVEGIEKKQNKTRNFNLMVF